MKKDEKRNIIAPMLNITLSINGSPALNLRTVRLSPANVPGRDALVMGSINCSFSSSLISNFSFTWLTPEPDSISRIVRLRAQARVMEIYPSAQRILEVKYQNRIKNLLRAHVEMGTKGLST